MLFVIFVCEQMNKTVSSSFRSNQGWQKKKIEMIRDKLNIVNSNCILFSRSVSVLAFFFFLRALAAESCNQDRRTESSGEFTFLPFYSERRSCQAYFHFKVTFWMRTFQASLKFWLCFHRNLKERLCRSRAFYMMLWVSQQIVVLSRRPLGAGCEPALTFVFPQLNNNLFCSDNEKNLFLRLCFLRFLCWREHCLKSIETERSILRFIIWKKCGVLSRILFPFWPKVILWGEPMAPEKISKVNESPLKNWYS